MRSVGIVAEFNPLHQGHVEHINESRRISDRTNVIVVMSGNFVQRGEPAILDKWLRTKAALLNGVDIVIELPVSFVLCGADYFARGAVELLEKTGVVDAISFGSESGNIDAIRNAAHVLATEPDLFKRVLKEKLGLGFSYAAARGFALQACLPDSPEGLFTKPNNGLGIEYVKAVKLLGSKMEIFTTHRKPGGPSATMLRKEILGGERTETGHLAPECEKMSRGMDIHTTENIFPNFFSVFRREQPQVAPKSEFLFGAQYNKYAQIDDFSDIFRYLLFTKKDLYLGEGLENRFRKFAGDFTKISEVIDAVKTKRYTHTRLQRAVLRTVLGLPNECGKPGYIRVLGFRRESADLLGSLVCKAKLPAITNGRELDKILTGGGEAGSMLRKELEAGDVYRIATQGIGGVLCERGNRIVIFS